MGPLKASAIKDKTGDFLLAIGTGLLINFILGVAILQLGPFIVKRRRTRTECN